ncbi:5-oxoprolinase subunit PxpB [Flavobacteriaceae bacterium GF1]
MSLFPITVKPFGDTAILMEWPQKVDEAILNDIIGFQEFLKTVLEAKWVMVPSYNSLTLICQNSDFEFTGFKDKLLEWYAAPRAEFSLKRNLWKLPVCYDLDFGLDLETTAQKLVISVEELVQRHTSHRYTVYSIGFLPGFMYLGGLPKNLETKRRASPRLHVAKGSVGLAGKQTGIYPQDSPGGWNIIGRCPVPMFNLNRKEPCFINVGDQIQFVPIERATFDLKIIEAEVGIYQPEKIVLDA